MMADIETLRKQLRMLCRSRDVTNELQSEVLQLLAHGTEEELAGVVWHLESMPMRMHHDRQLVLTPAADIKIRPVRWLWEGRLPAGTLVVPAGREGTGKSQFLIWLAAQITRGTLPGCCFGEPRCVLYCAVEDSWEHVIAPRLVAAGADMKKVYRVAVETVDSGDMLLSLPVDLAALAEETVRHRVALIALDPLLSFIHGSLDSHRNREMRTVLDPLANLADTTGAAVAGLAHFNKAGSSDVSNAITGSGAFKDVPRSIFGFARDEETGERIMTETKNNLGRDDLPSLRYRIEPVDIPAEGGEVAHVSRLVWEGESARSVGDLIRDTQTSPEERGALEDAEQWLTDLLADGSMKSDDVLSAARAAGHNEKTLRRAKKRLRVESKRSGDAWVWFPPGKMDKADKIPTHGQVVHLVHLDPACDRCGCETERLITHHATRDRLCPGCCAEVTG